jgi:hypothetical protein
MIKCFFWAEVTVLPIHHAQTEDRIDRVDAWLDSPREPQLWCSNRLAQEGQWRKRGGEVEEKTEFAFPAQQQTRSRSLAGVEWKR